MGTDGTTTSGGGTASGRPPAALRAVVIAGPTASGKSALASAVARTVGGAVVNADSMQVYRELAILTARPSAEEEAAVPHRLYGHVAAAERHTVARWLADVERVLADLTAEGRVPVVVGGTGLYLTALTTGLSPVPAVPETVAAAWRARGEGTSAEALHAALAAVDPAMADRLRPGDRQRILRALMVREATGRSLLDFQATRSPPLVPAGPDARFLVLSPDRALLHARIAERFRRMVVDGGLEEARRLDALGLDPTLPALRAIGVPEMIAAAAGRRPLDAAVEDATTATRRYARRQETWFRNQFADWTRLPVTADRPAVPVDDALGKR